MGWDDFAEIEKSLRTTRAVQDNRSGFHKKNRSGFLLASRKEQQRVIIFAREVFMQFSLPGSSLVRWVGILR